MNAVPCSVIKHMPARGTINQGAGKPRHLIGCDTVINRGDEFGQPLWHQIGGAIAGLIDFAGRAKGSEGTDEIATVLLALPSALNDRIVGMVLAGKGDAIIAGKHFCISHGNLLFGWVEREIRFGDLGWPPSNPLGPGALGSGPRRHR